MDSFHSRISAAEAESILAAVRAGGFLSVNENSVIVHDLDRLRNRLVALTNAFPSGTLHAIAIKANPLVEILRVCVQAGTGLEAASIEEVHLALAANCTPEKIIFDSPAKTVSEIEECLERGLHLNVDNFAELSRIESAIANRPTTSTIGLRINPEVIAGTISTTSVGSVGSKFGMSISRDRERIIDAFRKHDWLVGLHIHVGSQGCGLDLLCDGAEKIQSLRESIEAETDRKISIVDIGGGLPAAYLETDDPPSPSQYANQLRDRVPALMNGDASLMTEFGRSVHAGCGIAFSRVEYVRDVSDDHKMVVIHLGADFLLRPVYRSDDWKHEFLIFDKNGKLKTGADGKITIAGPLCFAGDILARELSMPRPEPGDTIAIRDCGAYTLSMWSRHCSRGIPTVVGYNNDEVLQLRPAELPADIVRTWSGVPQGD
nr:diaminopimelate decarboxylase [uncultured bacterium]